MTDRNVYFKDENGQTYISSPEYDYSLDIFLMLVVVATVLTGIPLCLYLGGL